MSSKSKSTFTLTLEPSKASESTAALDALLVNFFNMMSPRVRNRWVLNALRGATKQIVEGPGDLPTDFAQYDTGEFRQFSRVLRTMAQGEDLGASKTSSTQDSGSAPEPSPTRLVTDLRDVVEAEPSGNAAYLDRGSEAEVAAFSENTMSEPKEEGHKVEETSAPQSAPLGQSEQAPARSATASVSEESESVVSEKVAPAKKSPLLERLSEI